jgi:hypothetical protein
MLRYDQKMANIRGGRYTKADFMIADAKDSDMGSGVTGTGFDYSNSDSPRRRSRQEFISQIEEIIRQDAVDIMLVSASNLELLIERKAFDGAGVKPAIRANDTTDCWGAVRNGRYASEPSRPFRSANIARVMTGNANAVPGDAITGTDLGLYSITFLNDLDADTRALEEFNRFRDEAASIGFKYFYEVFNPNVETGLTREEIGQFVNDCILRSLAGVMRADRPQFLKIAYNGPKSLEELVSYDSELVVGVLGGGAGTTRDTFELLHQAERYGAKLGLFGRKINLAEAPLTLVTLMRQVVDGAVSPDEAVRAYHGELQKLGVRTVRSLEDDRKITEEVLMAATSRKAA